MGIRKGDTLGWSARLGHLPTSRGTIEIERYGTHLAAVIAFSAIWLNGEPASRELPVGDTDEVAVLPPVSGG